jgi:hypothetical protein
MRGGSEALGFFSSSTSRSKTTDFVVSVTTPTSSHTVDRFTEGCLRVIMSTATHAPKTTSDAKQKPGHHCGTPGLSMTK